MKMKRLHTRTMKLLIWLICVVLLFGCAGFAILLDDMGVALEKVDYYNTDLPSQFFGYRILCVADYHDSFYFDQIADIANREQPDMVLFLGDMTELNHGSYENTLYLLDAIDDSIPVYGVLGNHEVHSDSVQQISSDLELHGMKLLNNEKVTISRDGASIDLIGVRDVTDSDSALNGSWLVEQMRVYLEAVIEPNNYTLLACHRATLYEYLNDMPATLMLSGHVHGGQVRLPKIGGVFSSDGSLFPDYDKGFYSEGEMDLYVSSGCDFRPPRLRVFNGPSVTLLTLKK